jgi:glucose dehydrogenase
MMRYAEVPWPWAGVTIALVLLAQEALVKLIGDSSSLAMTSWRILVMTIGVTSLALILLPRRRPAYLLGALTCAALMGWALWLQYGLGLDPCPLCSLQRMVVIGIGVVFLVAGIHNPAAWARRSTRGSRSSSACSAPSRRCATSGSSRCRRARSPSAEWASIT